jgi:hypothetical protein
MSENQTETQSASLEVLPASALEAITRGEIDIQIATAHRYPRSLDMYKKRAIAMATIDVETAESCLYARPVGGGKVAEGMSVRMAEIVGSCYGNLRVGAIIIEQTETYIKARGVAHDLETNFASSSDIIESTLKQDGKTPYDARMRVTVAKAAVAKARRDATFQVVPRAIARPIERAVRALLADESIQTFEERRNGVVKWIDEKLKIDAKRVWAMLGITGPGDLQQEHLETLAGLKTALRENDTTIDEAFPGIVAKKPIFPEKKSKLSDSSPTETGPSNSGGEGPATPPNPESRSTLASGHGKELQTHPEKLTDVSENQSSPVADISEPQKELQRLIEKSGFSFAEIKAHFPRGLAPRDAKSLEDMTDGNMLKVIESFDVLVDIVKTQGKQAAP